MKYPNKTFILTSLLLFICNGLVYAEFKPQTHKDINSRVLIKVINELNLEQNESKQEICQTRLIRSQSIQDYFIPVQAKAHFDNCAFQKSINYINRIIAQNDKFAGEYLEKLNKGEKQKELDLLRRKILFNGGKILHAIQDFYAHTNYLEMMKDNENLIDVPTIEFWNKHGQNKIKELEAMGLISGKAWWVFPQKCKKNSPTHEKLSKDTENYILGKKKTVWINPESNEKYSGYEAAVNLAERSTYQFLLHTFIKYPMLKSYCANPKLPTKSTK